MAEESLEAIFAKYDADADGGIDLEEFTELWRAGVPRFGPRHDDAHRRLAYARKRVPSYCDRILWRSRAGLEGHLRQQWTTPVYAVTSSDHKPLAAQYSLRVRRAAFPTPQPAQHTARPAPQPFLSRLGLC